MDTYIDRNGYMRPCMDNKLQLVDVAVSDLHVALQYVRHRGMAFQAGGACGLWPLELSRNFTSVYTCEPVAENFACLEYNLRGVENVRYERCALGRTSGFARMKLDAFERDNCGAYYSEEPCGADTDVDTVVQRCVDDIYLPSLDFLQLDVEGRELDVLRGATRTLKAFKPVVMLEAKQLPHMDRWHVDKEDAIKHLKALGWCLIDTIKRDVIMVHEDKR